MQTAPRSLAASLRSSSPTQTVAALALLGGFLVVVLLLAFGAWREIGHLGHRRDEALASRSDPVSVAGGAAGAFRRLRATLGEGERFALVFGPDVDRDQKGFYRLVSLAVLYPAIAVSDPARADAVMVFGENPPPRVSGAFEPIGVVDGVWLGRRRG
jgi:hypothetical protein